MSLQMPGHTFPMQPYVGIPLLLQGPILAFLYAVKELQEERGGPLPVNVAFVFEVCVHVHDLHPGRHIPR
jgi:hypothetical protein